MSSKTVPCARCQSPKTIRKGFYRRKRNRQKIQKYLCQSCGVWFSDQSSAKDWAHKRPDLNQEVFELVSIGVGIRKICLKLRTTKKTVQRKILFAAQVCDTFHQSNMSRWTRKTKPRFQMDEMETFEELHGNTIKIPVIVEKDSHFIVDLTPMRDWSRSQYPVVKKRYNNFHHHEILQKEILFKDALKSCQKMKPEGRIVIDTDKHLQYPKLIKDVFAEKGVHIKWDSKVDGEKKELFPVNNVIACIRQDVAATRKKSWHIAKRKVMLAARLKIYTFVSNYLKKKSYRNGKSRIEMTPAMHLGIFNKPIFEVY
jgi:transposase-like protein